MKDSNKRRAVVQIVGNITLSNVQDYLPTNFEARIVTDTGGAKRIMIEGHDDHGWTLDGYVIPRLASGLITAKEVS